MNRSFCRHTEHASIFCIIPHLTKGNIGWNKTRSNLFCLDGFHVKPLGKPVKERQMLNLHKPTQQQNMIKKIKKLILTSSSASGISASSESWDTIIYVSRDLQNTGWTCSIQISFQCCILSDGLDYPVHGSKSKVFSELVKSASTFSLSVKTTTT